MSCCGVFAKNYPTLTISSSEPLVENVVSVVSVVSRICILRKTAIKSHDSRFPFFFSSKQRFLPSQSPVPVLSKSRCRPPIPLPSSPIPLPSSPIPVPVLSPPLPPSQRKQRNDTKPSRRLRGGVVGSKTEHSSPSPPPLLGTIRTREPLR